MHRIAERRNVIGKIPLNSRHFAAIKTALIQLCAGDCGSAIQSAIPFILVHTIFLAANEIHFCCISFVITFFDSVEETAENIHTQLHHTDICVNHTQKQRKLKGNSASNTHYTARSDQNHTTYTQEGESPNMDKWVITPGLPENSVSVCAVSDSTAAIRTQQALKKLGIEVIPVREHALLPKPCASHPDMLLCHLGGDNVIVGSEHLFRALQNFGANAVLTEQLPKAPYPKDISLNCLLLGNRLFANLKYTAPEILAHAEQNNIAAIAVSQGYARCSVCVVDENSIITADESIRKAAERIGAEVLLIRPGSIKLPGYDYGFIGGCCGQIGKRHIAFCGKLETHPDGERIRQFLERRNIRITELPSPDGALWDIGGIIPLMERT